MGFRIGFGTGTQPSLAPGLLTWFGMWFAPVLGMGLGQGFIVWDSTLLTLLQLRVKSALWKV